jgi:hypothetical protein
LGRLGTWLEVGLLAYAEYKNMTQVIDFMWLDNDNCQRGQAGGRIARENPGRRDFALSSLRFDTIKSGFATDQLRVSIF